MTNVDLFRHALATLAYRGGAVLRNAPPEFADFRAGINGRSAGEILAHMGDLLDWTLTICNGSERWHEAAVFPWDEGAARFFAGLERLDPRLAEPISGPLERLFQGPIADALTHVGQLAMMRRMAGAPICGENYYVAAITAGRVGADQAKPVKTFE
jgi:hypothetical protein